MHFLDKIWSSATYVVSILTLSPVRGPVVNDQTPLGQNLNVQHHDVGHVEHAVISHEDVHTAAIPGPIFKPPSGRVSGPGSDFKCDYSRMVGWEYCSDPSDRGCWLRKVGGDPKNPNDTFNINSNYEVRKPTGVTRRYRLDLHDDFINQDGMYFDYAKIFNGQYPGPWIQACWGDQVIVDVHNHLKHNGTSIHWHGIRQLNTMHMDGVNGITQCPIAPGDSFTYNWTAIQYGSSWYHSHYSVQYADGALGPMTLHGPTSDQYDEAKLPILLTDWGHNSAFEAIWTQLDAPSILINGIGNVTRYNNANQNTAEVPALYELKVEPPVKAPGTGPSKGKGAKRYLLRLINTSFESTFIFSIDEHNLIVVEADFVPIKPYVTQSVLIGIGQRYHVIFEATDPRGTRANYWLRTWRAKCFLGFPANGSADYEKTGYLSYDQSPAAPTDIVNNPWPIDFTCSDEKTSDLKPIVSWPKITPPVNDPVGHAGQNLTVIFKAAPDIFPKALASMGSGEDIKNPEFNPMQVSYGDPTFLHLNYTGKWPPLWVVYPENFKDDSFVWMVIQGPQNTNNSGVGAAAHPIHLHGHDFAILQQNYNDNWPINFKPNLDTPPRRDVVLLPDAGYVVIAFKTDNPGTWIMHCHIAQHASFGLAMQIMERQQAAADIWPSLQTSHALQNAQKTCNNWNKWQGNCMNWWPGDGSSCPQGINEFSPDSGI